MDRMVFGGQRLKQISDNGMCHTQLFLFAVLFFILANINDSIPKSTQLVT
jgi:hypothetical protein